MSQQRLLTSRGCASTGVRAHSVRNKAHKPRRLRPCASSRRDSSDRETVLVTSKPSVLPAALSPLDRLQSLPASVAEVKSEWTATISAHPASQKAQQLVDQYWESLPARYKLVVASSLSFVICNMDKVNMSVAIIPMAHEFGWSPSVAGLVQSSFFWGYILCQLPGGYLSSSIGGRKVLPAGVGMWSIATAAVPLLASTVPGLCFCRAAVGLGEAVAPSAATDMVARTVPKEERSRAVATIFGGLHVGSILGLLAAPVLITNFGWETVFVSFGAAGLVWCLWYESLMKGISEKEPALMARLSGGSSTMESPTSTSTKVPYRAFLRSRPVQALMYTHFCNNWFHYTMLAWLPTYFVDTLSVDLMHAAQTALLPPLAGIVASSLAGPAADTLISKGWKVATVRKLAQCTAFLVPSACLIATSFTEDATATVALITAALGISSFSLAGLYCTHQDLSPRYASAMLGLTNTTGAIPGIIGVAITGLLFDETGSWGISLFAPSIVFFLTGSLVYTLFSRSDPVDFDQEELNRPFAIEGWLEPLNTKLEETKQKTASLQERMSDMVAQARSFLRR